MAHINYPSRKKMLMESKGTSAESIESDDYHLDKKKSSIILISTSVNRQEVIPYKCNTIKSLYM